MLVKCMSQVSVLVVFLVAAAGFALAQDNWLGGTGNWSDGALWSTGVPLPANNVLINSGGPDSVTLDVSTTINSLTLGGDNFTSELTDGGAAQTLSITRALNVGGSGYLNLYGGTAVAAGAASSNEGRIDLENASALTVAGNFTNSLLLTALNGGGGNTVTITGMLTNNGTFYLLGAGDMATIGNGLSNGGTLDVADGTLRITGDGNNTFNGGLSTGGTLTITGDLMNQGGFNVAGSGASASMRTLTNYLSAGVSVDSGATLDAMRVDNYNLISVFGGTMVVGTGTPRGPGYYQFANGTLGEFVTAFEFSQIRVDSGVVNLNGTLDIIVPSGGEPGVGSTFQFLLFNPGSLSGTFASIQNDIFAGGTEKWVVIYNDSGGYVGLMAEKNLTPEPSSLLLLGSGVLAGIGALRRKLTR